VNKPAYDSKGKAYGFENGVSCVGLTLTDNQIVKDKNNVESEQSVQNLKPKDQALPLRPANSVTKKVTEMVKEKDKVLPTVNAEPEQRWTKVTEMVKEKDQVLPTVNAEPEQRRTKDKLCQGAACCKQKVRNPSYDRKERAYGFENGQSCIVVGQNSDLDTVFPTAAPTLFKQNEIEVTPTATKFSLEKTTTTPSYSVRTTSSTATSKQPYANGRPTVVPLEGYLTVFPLLPSPVVDPPFLDKECNALNSEILADVANCTFPFTQSIYNSYKHADKAAVDIIDCICTTSFRVGKQDVDAHVRKSCPAPGNMTKSDFFSLKDGCSVIPYNYLTISNSLNVYARMMNGESYIPFSISSGYRSQGLIPMILYLVMYII
jgi:hypothetical protein